MPPKYHTYLCYRPDEDDPDDAEAVEARSAKEAAVAYCEYNDFDLEDEFDVLVKVADDTPAPWQKFNIVREVQVEYVAYPQGVENE